MTELSTEKIETDVLVIGAGGAGLRAAIELKNSGCDVRVAAKGKFPSGCTPVSMGGMLVAFDDKDSVDTHYQDTLAGGDRLNNRALVRLLADRACERARDLEGYGTAFRKRDDHYLLFPYTGSRVARGVVADAPYAGGYVRGLVKEIERLGVEVIPHVMIVDLLKDGDAVVGAVGLDTNEDTVVVFAAKAVVLATGGAGNLYRLTTNPPGLTGDGYALAYRAGALLQDMEFVQGRVCMISPKGMRGIPPPGDGLVTIGGRFYNSLCERYMHRYFPDKLEQVTRAQMSICAQKEIQAGRHTADMGVYGDLSGVPAEELERFQRFMGECEAEGFDPTWQPYEWAPGVHHFMGGVVINDRCETGAPGLYAAGEITGGVHGANRLAGNALTETQVFGAIAGSSAAGYCRGARDVTGKALRAAAGSVSRLEKLLARDGGEQPATVRETITETMTRYVGVIRNREELSAAARKLEEARKSAANVVCPAGAHSTSALAEVLEVEFMLTVAEMVVEAAGMREETRGAHNREDFPLTSTGWDKNIVFQAVQGARHVTVKSLDGAL